MLTLLFPFDELPAYHTDPKKLVTSLERTHRWEQRSLEKHLENRNNQATVCSDSRRR
ncbi:MAG: hypothetical protein LVQ75_01610 [Candidatus Babeliales bacterium]